MRKRVLAIVVFVLIGAAVVYIALYPRTPRFVVMNATSQEVHVTALWRNETKHIGIMQPSAQYTFTVQDEAGMRFAVRYANGRVVESTGIYFTSGTVVLATISESGIDVRYDEE